MAKSKKRGREDKLDCLSQFCTSSSPSILRSFNQHAAPRWSKEVLEAIAVHLSLLQKHYCKVNGQSEANSLPAICADDLRSDGSGSTVLDGHGDDDDSNTADKDGWDNSTKQDGIDAIDIADLINCQGPALPEDWEKHLDVRTGKVFYIHWKSCKKSHTDPRMALRKANEQISELVRHVKKRAHISPQSDVSEEASTSESITSHSASLFSCIDEEVQSMPDPFCSSS